MRHKNWQRAFRVRGYQAHLEFEAGNRPQGRQRKALLGGLKKRIAETEKDKRAKKRPLLLLRARSGEWLFVRIRSAPLKPNARRPCLLLRPVSVSAVFALWAVVGVPASVVF